MRDVAPDAGLSRPGINHVVVGSRDRQAANRRSSFLVEHRRPRHRTVGGLPHAAAGRAEIICRRISRNSRRRQRPSATERPDQPVFHALKWLVFRLGRFRLFVVGVAALGFRLRSGGRGFRFRCLRRFRLPLRLSLSNRNSTNQEQNCDCHENAQDKRRNLAKAV